MSVIIKKPKVESEERKNFKCLLHKNSLEFENEFRLFRKLLNCRVR